LDKDWNTYSISFFFNKAKFGNLFKEKYTEYTPAYFKYQIFSQNNNTINIFDKTKNDTYNIKIPVELDIVFIGTIYGFDDGNNLYLIIQTDKILNPEQISSWKSHNIVRPTYICKISLKGEIIASFKINSVVGFDGMVTANGNIYQYHKIYINNYNKSTGRAITKWYIEK
jgi:hypothetical protein